MADYHLVYFYTVFHPLFTVHPYTLVSSLAFDRYSLSLHEEVPVFHPFVYVSLSFCHLLASILLRAFEIRRLYRSLRDLLTPMACRLTFTRKFDLFRIDTGLWLTDEPLPASEVRGYRRRSVRTTYLSAERLRCWQPLKYGAPQCSSSRSRRRCSSSSKRDRNSSRCSHYRPTAAAALASTPTFRVRRLYFIDKSPCHLYRHLV